MIKSKIIKARVAAISISQKKGIPKTNVPSAFLIKEHGIEGDAHAGKWHRQVSFLELESIVVMRKKGVPNLRPGMFAENITTENFDVSKLSVGSKVKRGMKAELIVTQVGKECHNKCAIFTKAGDCIMPREGIFAEVLKGGEISVNDTIEVIR